MYGTETGYSTQLGYESESGYGGTAPPVCETLFSNYLGDVTALSSNTGVKFDGPDATNSGANTSSTYTADSTLRGVYFSVDFTTFVDGDSWVVGISDAFPTSTNFVAAFFTLLAGVVSVQIFSSGSGPGSSTIIGSPLASDEFCLAFTTTANETNLYRNQSQILSDNPIGTYTMVNSVGSFPSVQASGGEVFLLQSPTEIGGVTRYCTNA